MAMTMRLVLLCVLLLALAQASSQQEQQQEPHAPSSDIIDASEHAHLSAAVSGCGLCERTGQCDHAFRGGQGQFCQTLVSGAPCCCPSDAQCVLSNAYNCRCRRSSSSATNIRHHQSAPSPRGAETASSSTKPSTLLLLCILLCCVCCCCCGASETRKKHREHHDYYAPVAPTATTQYGTYANDSQAPLAQPVYHPANASSYAYASAPPACDSNAPYASYHHQQEQQQQPSGYATGALGAVAGLGAGVFLGSAFSRANDSNVRNTSSYVGNHDSGGDSFGVAGSTVEFSGDTGDFGGDDGGDDFAGDS